MLKPKKISSSIEKAQTKSRKGRPAKMTAKAKNSGVQGTQNLKSMFARPINTQNLNAVEPTGE